MGGGGGGGGGVSGLGREGVLPVRAGGRDGVGRHPVNAVPSVGAAGEAKELGCICKYAFAVRVWRCGGVRVVK